jgi:isopentenyl phosphate kinase
VSKKLVLLKLGGSLITEKNRPHTPRPDVMQRLAEEIAEARSRDGNLQIVLGHGSGSFGHVPASKYRTRLGVKTPEEWLGFVEVWREASALTHLVLGALEAAGLPALVLPPLAMVIAKQGKVTSWNLDTLRHALDRKLLPVIHGDVAFDTALGGTILSTEDLFSYLTGQLHPTQVLLAGIEPGVWADFPHNTRLLEEITPASFAHLGSGLSGASATDVTGGMAEKVRQALSFVEASPELKVAIFSGEVAGNVRMALLGEAVGTQVHA